MNPPPDMAVNAHIEHMWEAARSLEMDLVKLRYYLRTKPGAEMTPDQARRLVDMLAPIGKLTTEIIYVDLDRTARREGVVPEYDA